MASSDGPFLSMAVFCERAIQEKDDVLSLVRIFQRLTVVAEGPSPPEGMPPMTQSLTLVVGFISGAAKGRHKVKIRTYAPSGLQTSESPALNLLFEGDDRGANAIVNINITLDQEGVYWFEVLLNDQPQTRVPLRIIYQSVVTR